VLVSSHLLSEVEQVCTHLGVMSDGHLVAQGTVAEIRQGAVSTVRVQTGRVDAAATVLADLGVGQVRTVGHEVHGVPGDLDPERIVAALVAAGVGVRGFVIDAPSLEDLFVTMTGEGFDVSG
ncbi:MAG: DUF4162 domain-containing protein, partial [Nostocoides sp.]